MAYTEVLWHVARTSGSREGALEQIAKTGLTTPVTKGGELRKGLKRVAQKDQKLPNRPRKELNILRPKSFVWLQENVRSFKNG